MLTNEQLNRLAATGLDITRPTGLNDNHRVNMVDPHRPFLAIDKLSAQEVDDAFRVRRIKTGGYIVEIAIADGSQVPNTPSIIARALSNIENRYDPVGNPYNQILPPVVAREHELRGSSQRALVISEEYTEDTQPVPRSVKLCPAYVNVLNIHAAEFGGAHIRNMGLNWSNSPAIRFAREFRSARGIPTIPANEQGEDKRSLANQLVPTYMVIANMAVAKWSIHEQVPILYRIPGLPWSVLFQYGPQKHGPRGYSPVRPELGNEFKSLADIVPYTHATSPLRRSADLINHMQIGNHLAGNELPFSWSALLEISQKLAA